jgi:hypothetical protein
MGRMCGTCGGKQMRIETRAMEPNWRLRSDLAVGWIDVAQHRVKRGGGCGQGNKFWGLVNAGNFVTGNH